MLLRGFWNTHANESIVGWSTTAVRTAPACRTSAWTDSGLADQESDTSNSSFELGLAGFQIGQHCFVIDWLIAHVRHLDSSGKMHVSALLWV
jgi:hypothetical protein